MLAHRLRRCTNIDPAFGERLVFVLISVNVSCLLGYHSPRIQTCVIDLARCWVNVGPASQTVEQHWIIILCLRGWPTKAH